MILDAPPKKLWEVWDYYKVSDPDFGYWDKSVHAWRRGDRLQEDKERRKVLREKYGLPRGPSSRSRADRLSDNGYDLSDDSE